MTNEVEVKERYNVFFKRIGYEVTVFNIYSYSLIDVITFELHKKSIDDIKEIIYRFCEAYEIDWEQLSFKTSPENYNRLNMNTLYGKKTLNELFSERNIRIGEGKNDN